MERSKSRREDIGLSLRSGCARKKDAESEFIEKDIRDLSFSEEFDVVTCWYDSLNYILEEELKQVFDKSVYKLLFTELLIRRR